MGERLTGKVAIVTGAGRGIGRAEAMALAAEGAAVVVNDAGVRRDGTGEDRAPADEVVAEIRSHGGAAAANYEDITDFENGRAIIAQAAATFGRLDILVNNAGIQINRSLFDITEEDFDRTLRIHLRGHWSMCRAAIEQFRAQGEGGCIVNTSSLAGLGQMRHVDYCAAKEGIVGLTRAMALELLPFGIRVNDIRPRALTRMVTEVLPGERGALPGFSDESEPGRAPGDASGGNRDARVVGAMVAFLASDAATGITGRDFFVAGNEISLLSVPVRERTISREGGWDIEAIEAAFPTDIAPAIGQPLAY